MEISPITAQKNRIRKAIQTGQTVLLTGLAGVGKTALIKEITNELGFDSVYYSAPTMDVFLEFTGIPEKVQTDSGVVLKFALPENYFRTRPWVLFVDEVNRADKRVTNALFEIAQFGSVNGRKLPNLVTVVAAANPPSDENSNYHTNDFDEAFKDRFTLQEEIIARIDEEYFSKQFSPSMAQGAKEYWNGLSEELRKQCSPRRLEKACLWYTINGSTQGVLNGKNLNYASLDNLLQKGGLEYKIEKYARDNDVKAAKEFINKHNQFHLSSNYIANSTHLTEFYFDAMNPELQLTFVSNNTKMLTNAAKDITKYVKVLRKVADSGDENLKNSIASQFFTFAEAKKITIDQDLVEIKAALDSLPVIEGGQENPQELMMKTIWRCAKPDDVLSMDLKDPTALVAALNIYRAPEGPDTTPGYNDEVEEQLLDDNVRAAAFRVAASLHKKTPVTDRQMVSMLGYWKLVKPIVAPPAAKK